MRSDDAVQEARDFEPFHPIQKCPKSRKKIMSSYAAIGSFVHWMIFNGRPAFNNNNQHAALLYIILPLYWKLFFTFSCYHNSLIISFTLSDSPKNHTFSPLFQCSRAAFVTWICAAKDNTFSLLLLKPPTSSIHPPLPAPSPHSYCGFIHPNILCICSTFCCVIRPPENWRRRKGLSNNYGVKSGNHHRSSYIPCVAL